MPVAEDDWGRAAEVLRSARRVALACHVDPDGDALGSMLGLELWLRRQGIPTVAGWGRARETDDDSLSIPPQYSFLPGLSTLVDPSQFPTSPEVMIAFDTGAPARLGTLREHAERARTLVLIDHHAVGIPFGDVRLVAADAAATAILVEELITRMGGEIDREIATCLYTAVLTDTGRFTYESTTPEVLRFAARMLEAGVDHAAITRHIYETSSFGYVKVLGAALQRAQLVPEVGLAWMAVTQDELVEAGVSWQETEGFIDVLRRVEAARCTLVAKEQNDGYWKVSMRSRGGIDVGLVARDLGGGGHRMSAAFVAPGPLEDMMDRVVERMTVQMSAPQTPGPAGWATSPPLGAAASGDVAP